jgi:hypothetical protein
MGVTVRNVGSLGGKLYPTEHRASRGRLDKKSPNFQRAIIHENPQIQLKKNQKIHRNMFTDFLADGCQQLDQ